MAPTNNLLPHITSVSHLVKHLCIVLNDEHTRRLVKEKNPSAPKGKTFSHHFSKCKYRNFNSRYTPKDGVGVFLLWSKLLCSNTEFGTSSFCFVHGHLHPVFKALEILD